jgi:hypothetical protein
MFPKNIHINQFHFLTALVMIAVAITGCSSTAVQPTSMPTPLDPTPTMLPAAKASPVPTVESATPTTAVTAVVTPIITVAATYTDPFAYCSAVVNADIPDASFVGPKMPDNILSGIMKAAGASPDAPVDVFRQSSFWRCMDGKVYGCTVGANLPCESKANTDKTPTQAETDFCTSNPNSDFIPAVVTGHETIYDWHCNQKTPEIGKTIFKVDTRGFIADIWYLLSPQ